MLPFRTHSAREAVNVRPVVVEDQVAPEVVEVLEDEAASAAA